MKIANCLICGNKHYSKGLCESHYRAYRANRDKFPIFEDFIRTWFPYRDTPAEQCQKCGVKPSVTFGLCEEHHTEYLATKDKAARRK